MGEGKPQSSQNEAHANVSQDTIKDPAQWNKGTPKHPGDAATTGLYPNTSEENAHAGDTTSVAQRSHSEKQASAPAGQHDGNPSTYGSMKDGRPASGATSNAEKKVDGEDAFK